MNVRAFLLHLKRVAEAKVRTRNITGREQVVDLLISSLDPFECCDFIQSNADNWYASKNPQFSFVCDFVSRYIPDLNDASAWDDYDAIMTGARIDSLPETHTFIQRVKILKSALSADWFAEKAEILRLRKRVPLDLVLPLCATASTPTTFDGWVGAIASGVEERLRELGVQGVPASLFDPPPIVPPIVPPAVPHTPMDVDALTETLIARMQDKGVWGRVGEGGTDKGGKPWNKGGKEGKGGNKGGGKGAAKGGKDGKGGKVTFTNTSTTSTTPNTTSTSTQCYNCKGWGHLAWQCPSPARSSPNE
jgi:hypothetical protein